jgi:hypothetical protein
MITYQSLYAMGARNFATNYQLKSIMYLIHTKLDKYVLSCKQTEQLLELTMELGALDQM